jgi:hypothetical protein
MTRASASRLAWVIAFASACSSRGPSNADPPPTSSPTDVYRLTLTGNDKAASLVRVERSTVRSDELPMAALGGQFVAIAYAGAAVKDAAFVRFPSVGVVDSPDDGPSEVAVPSAPAVAFVRADAAVDHVDVVDLRGNVALTIPLAELPVKAQSLRPETLSLGEGYGHIRVLEPGDDALIAAPLKDPKFGVSGPLGTESFELDKLYRALDALTPIARQSIATIGVVKMTGGYEGLTFGSTVLLNVALFSGPPKYDSLAHVTSHEAAHAFNNLVDDTAAPQGLPADAVSAVTALQKKYRLARGLTKAWGALNQTAVDIELAAPYGGDGKDDAGAPGRGFASGYGGTNVKDDLAEYVGLIQTPDARARIPEGAGLTNVCAQLRSAPTLAALPKPLTIDYVKVTFLHALGVIDDPHFTACVGPLASPSFPTGITLGVNQPDDTIALTGTKAGPLDQDGAHFAAVLGDGPNGYGFLLRVLAPTDQPLGVHRLDNINLLTVDEPNNAVYLPNSVDDLKARASGGGLVLVTDWRPDKVQGAIFFLTLQNGFGAVTDTFPFSSFSFKPTNP